ncbi:inner membrane protein [Bordetella pertussis]|nr:inner membrane protein [Bordetella pertussis]CRE20752.1 inner membrane protein [Bordetella pertussis]
MQIGGVRFGSTARRAGWEQGWDVLELRVPNPARPAEFWAYLPGLVLLALVWFAQGRRQRAAAR